MASPVELAVVELQIVVREFSRRLAAMEQRLGLRPEEFGPRMEGGRPYVPLGRERREVVSRTAEAGNEPYEVAGGGSRTAVTTETVGAAAAWARPGAAAAAPAAPSAEPVVAATPVSGSAPMPMAVPVAFETPAAESKIEDNESKIEGPIPVLPPEPPPRPEPPAKKVADFLRAYNPPPKPESALERTLGVEVASWLAALAIIGGVVFFLQWGMDSGNTVFSPAVRVGLALLAGALMVGHGTWLHVTGLKAISAALLGSGLAVMMAALFAANIAFAVPVLTQGQAFLAVPAVAALGLGLGLYTRSVMLPVLAFAGLYLSPAILNSGIDRSEPFLVYLLIVTAAALGLAQLRRSWEFLRLIAFAAAWVWVIEWTAWRFSGAHEALGVGAISGLFLMFLLVMKLNLWRALAREPAQAPAERQLVAYWDAVAAIFTPVNCAAAVAAFSVLFTRGRMEGLWVPVAAMGVVMGLLGLALRTRYFGVCASAQAVALFLAAVPLYLDHGTVAPGYAFLALGFGLYAHLTNSQYARIYMFGALLLMAGQFFAFDSVDPRLQKALWTAAGTAVTPWMLMGWGAGLLALVLAWLSRPTSRQVEGGGVRLRGAPWATVACIAVSTLLVFVVNIRALEPGGPFTLAAVIWVLALLGVLRSGALADIGSAVETLIGVLLMLLSVKWLMYEGITMEAAPLAGEARSGLPLINLFTLNGVILAGAIVLLSPLRDVPAVGRRFVAWWITALAFGLVNIQALRGVDYLMSGVDVGKSVLGRPEFVKSVALTGLWALFASVMIAWGFMRKAPSVRYVALALLAVAVGKVVFVDLATVETPLRVLAFMTLGIVLFVVSYLYHRHVRQLPGAG